MLSSDRIKEAMETLLKIFQEDNLEKVARAVFRGGDIPADKWSFLNRVLMYLNETDDARGFRQWQEVGRYVKKGSKAFYILAPMIKKTTEEKSLESGETVREEKQMLAGLRPGQRTDQEVTAEFSAAVIARLMGYKIPLGNVREYIENYSFRELMSCLARIEKIVSYVIGRTDGRP